MYRAHQPDDPGQHTNDQFTDNPGFLDRMVGSFGVLCGIYLVILAFGFLYLNECRAVETSWNLDEGLKAVVPLHSNIHEVYDKYNERLVHLTGKLQSDMVLSDWDYGVAVKAVTLIREVAIYQWVEYRSTKEYIEGDEIRVETTYSYRKEWRTKHFSSQKYYNPYGHQNPSSIPIYSYVKHADPVFVGAFKLSQGLISKVYPYHRFNAKEIPAGMGHFTIIVDGVFYHTHNPFYPTIGDVRVTFWYTGLSGKSRLGDPLTVSIVARQHGGTLTAFHTSSDHSLELIYPGELSAKEIFDTVQSADTWVNRAICWFLLFLGFLMLTSILTTLVSWLPIVRELVGLGVTLICLCLATSLSLVVIAIGWIAHRPLLGMALLAAAAVPFVLSRFRQTKKKKESNSVPLSLKVLSKRTLISSNGRKTTATVQKEFSERNYIVSTPNEQARRNRRHFYSLPKETVTEVQPSPSQSASQAEEVAPVHSDQGNITTRSGRTVRSPQRLGAEQSEH